MTAGMWLVGCAYNFCWEHDSLRREMRRAEDGSGRADAGDGGGADGSSVDDAGVVEPSCAAPTLGRPQASGRPNQKITPKRPWQHDHG